MTVEIVPVTGLPEFRAGDDLAALLVEPLRALGLRDGDIVVITQKIVSKAEGRVVPVSDDDRTTWIARETRRVVARRGDLTIAETAHGFVCANAGVDSSNVPAGFVSLLPEDPDGSAERIRRELVERFGVARLGVVITDTFGRPWRVGLVNVAIGCAGLPAIVDLRGNPDHLGRELEVTVVALADEVAGATGLVMGKASRIPVAIVRGVDVSVADEGSAADLVRPPEEDLFRTSPMQLLVGARTARTFGHGRVPRDALEEAMDAAAATPGIGQPSTMRFTAVESEAERHHLLEAIAGADPDAATLRAAAALVVPWLRFTEVGPRATVEDVRATQDRSLLAGGAAIRTLTLALQSRGLATVWTASTMIHQHETRAALGIEDTWFALGTVAVGLAAPDPSPRAWGDVDLGPLADDR